MGIVNETCTAFGSTSLWLVVHRSNCNGQIFALGLLTILWIRILDVGGAIKVNLALSVLFPLHERRRRDNAQVLVFARSIHSSRFSKTGFCSGQFVRTSDIFLTKINPSSETNDVGTEQDPPYKPSTVNLGCF